MGLKLAITLDELIVSIGFTLAVRSLDELISINKHMGLKLAKQQLDGLIV